MGPLPGPGQLWQSRDSAVWRGVLRKYQDAVAAVAKSGGKGKERLIELDRWYLQELPPALAAKSPGDAGGAHITREQLVKLVDWKLCRGKWRPRLQAFAQQQPDGAVEAASAAALRAIASYNPHAGAAGAEAGHSGKGTAAPSKRGAGASTGAGVGPDPDLGPLRAATEALAALKGVGPATASALLAAACPHAPFMSDEAAAAALPAARKSDYSLKAYLELAAALQRKAAELNSAQEAQQGQEQGQGRQQQEGQGPAKDSHAGPAAGEDVPPQGASGQQRQGEAKGAEGSSPEQEAGVGGEGKGEGEADTWTAVLVERCLWAAHVLHAYGAGGGGGEEEDGGLKEEEAQEGAGKGRSGGGTAGKRVGVGAGGSGKRTRK